MQKHFLLLCVLLPASLLVSLAAADGVGPLRKMTEAEAASAARVRETIEGALPKPPDGYSSSFSRESEVDEGMLPEVIAPGGMFRISYTATYTLDPAIRPAREQAAMMEKAKGTPEQQAKLAELVVKGADLKEERDAARDRSEKEAIRARLKAVHDEEQDLYDEIAKEYQAWVAEGGMAAVTQEIDAALPADAISIRITINGGVSVIGSATPYPVEGMPLAFEQREGCPGADSYCITVLIGPYEKADTLSGYTRYKLPDPEPGAATDARAIAVVVGGPKEKPGDVQAMLRAIDWAKLKALVL